MKSQEEQIEERLEQMPKRYRKMYKKAMTGKARQIAVRSFCLECCGYQEREVTLCTDLGCPLYSYRETAEALYKRRKGGADSGKSKN